MSKVTFSKFEGTGFREDDREADVLVDGAKVGTITAIIGDFGGILETTYQVEEYDVSLWIEKEEDWAEESFRVRSLRSGKLVQTAASAKRQAKEWILRTMMERAS